MNNNNIRIKGARVNNLKNIDLEIPRNKFIVITGVSGSGKSSLAFDTLYAEGQRRYVESLSAYARQFLGRMQKPECDYIKGLPPAIAIEQKVNTRNPRSTVGTSSEIYDYMRMLFARVGHTFSPISGCEVKKETIDNIVRSLSSLPAGTRIAVLSEIRLPAGRKLEQQLDIYSQEGYSRLEHDGEFLEISDLLADKKMLKKVSPEKYRLLIDRLAVSDDSDEISRLADSLETAYFEGHDECLVKIWLTDGSLEERRYSKRFSADGMDFLEPSDLMFNFNNPYGACPVCEGFGKVLGVDENLVVPDRTLSIYEDAVQCWRGEKMSECKHELVRLASRYNFPIHTPYAQLTKQQLDFLWHGKGSWPGIDGFFRWVDQNQYKIQYRVLKARYRGKTVCPECGGSRLRKEAQYVKVAGRSIGELVKMPVTELKAFFRDLQLPDTEMKIASRLLTEIRNRLGFLDDVGLGYLTLDRLSNTLSGGESQRINLATSLGSSLVGSLYILDEPSIGLHPRDTDRLIRVLRQLRDQGNTVVVVEHDEEIIRMADYLVDIGKDAGRLGGNIVFRGPLQAALSHPEQAPDSYTVAYLSGRQSVSYDPLRKPWKKSVKVHGAIEHNLKGIDVEFPLGVMTVVTGVSGSGKSTLVREVLYKALLRHLGEPTDAPGACKKLSGNLSDIARVEFVDQNPIGTSSRSNPATYLKAFDEIRQLMASLQGSRQMGFTPAFFSFNADGGRCEECKGEGVTTIPMQFMADIRIPCEACGGKRFKHDILEIEYRGMNIADILDMTVDRAIEFFGEKPDNFTRKILRRLQPLRDVGLGYVKLGQPSSTLSGGESQRVKLASFLAQESPEPTLFIFDEPTTGLHFHDIDTLLKSLRRLIDKGHSVLIIEHNLDVIKAADWIIDIGPEGGEKGGSLVAAGTPETIAATEDSHTGRYLRAKLKNLQ